MHRCQEGVLEVGIWDTFSSSAAQYSVLSGSMFCTVIPLYYAKNTKNVQNTAIAVASS